MSRTNRPAVRELADQRLELRLTKSELAAIDEAVAVAHQSRTEWILEACERHLDTERPATIRSHPRARLQRLLGDVRKLVDSAEAELSD